MPKHKLSLPRKRLLMLLRQAWELWRTMVRGPVRTYD